jgi:hypothetical protein
MVLLHALEKCKMLQVSLVFSGMGSFDDCVLVLGCFRFRGNGEGRLRVSYKASDAVIAESFFFLWRGPSRHDSGVFCKENWTFLASICGGGEKEVDLNIRKLTCGAFRDFA